jgi:hypothetical protein
MYRLVPNLIKAFHMAYIVITYFVGNPYTFGFTLLYSFLF